MDTRCVSDDVFRRIGIWIPANVSATTTDETLTADFVHKAVQRALDYDQGNRQSLMDVQDDFTLQGWREFMESLSGFVDEQGAPTGSSVFTAAGKAIVKTRERGMVRLAIPGTLKQQSKNSYGGLSTTSYRVMVDVQVGGNPLKIQHLQTRTCGPKPCDD